MEVQEFPSEPLRMPHASLRHHMYVYPRSVDLKATGFRNITCRVELLDHEVCLLSLLAIRPYPAGLALPSFPLSPSPGHAHHRCAGPAVHLRSQRLCAAAAVGAHGRVLPREEPRVPRGGARLRAP